MGAPTLPRSAAVCELIRRAEAGLPLVPAERFAYTPELHGRDLARVLGRLSRRPHWLAIAVIRTLLVVGVSVALWGAVGFFLAELARFGAGR